MDLNEAFKSAADGNFVAHLNFGRNESMHMFNGNYYYEDGATNLYAFLRSQEWAKQGWYIKYEKEEVNVEKLAKMHKDARGYTLGGSNKTYEECIVELLIS